MRRCKSRHFRTWFFRTRKTTASLSQDPYSPILAPLTLPATTEDVQAALSRIGVDGKRYEEIYLTEYQTDVPGMASRLGEYESVDELNYLAALLEELDDAGELDKFEAAVALGEYTGSVKDLINLAQNLDCYELYPGVGDNEALGRCYIDELLIRLKPRPFANGGIALAMAFICSPVGLPAVAGWVVEKLVDLDYSLRRFITTP